MQYLLKQLKSKRDILNKPPAAPAPAAPAPAAPAPAAPAPAAPAPAAPTLPPITAQPPQPPQINPQLVPAAPGSQPSRTTTTRRLPKKLTSQENLQTWFNLFKSWVLEKTNNLNLDSDTYGVLAGIKDDKNHNLSQYDLKQLRKLINNPDAAMKIKDLIDKLNLVKAMYNMVENFRFHKNSEKIYLGKTSNNQTRKK